MASPNISHLKSALNDIIAKRPHSLQAAVAGEALDYDKPENFFSDLLAHGCISGMVSSLIYYSDTHAFFDKHYDAIETIREELEDSLGCPLSIKGDLKNHLAWLAFEEAAYQLACELGIDC